jgi:HEAT repeat protein
VKLDPDAVRAWLASNDVDALATWLMSGTHHGKPGAPQAIKVAVIGLLRQELSPAKQRSWASKLARRDEPIARCVACGLVAGGWEHDAASTARRMRKLAEDPDWEVREWAADAVAAVLDRDFDAGFALCRDWVESGSEAACRAVALALAARAKERRAEQAAPMLALIERLLPMDGSYLQKNLGPFAVGGGFLSRFPEETLALLERLVSDDDENTRWNVAMAFTAAAARDHAKRGTAVLAKLAGDERKRVARAVEKARRNLAR